MTVFFEPSASTPISLDAFIDKVEREVDFDDVRTLEAMGYEMQRLAVQPQWFIGYLNEQLTEGFPADRSHQNRYSSASFVLWRGKDYMIRANTWFPVKDAIRRNVSKALFAEDLLHDHNFDLLTVGLLGDGYETEIFEYSYQDCLGYAGEEIEASSMKKYRLKQGSSLLMERGKTIHRQLPPRNLSVSLNLMSQTEACIGNRQYEFEEFNGGLRVKSIHYDTYLNPGATENLLNMCASFFNENTKDIITGIYSRLCRSPSENEAVIVLLLDWFKRVGIPMDSVPPLQGRISPHLRERISRILLFSPGGMVFSTWRA